MKHFALALLLLLAMTVTTQAVEKKVAVILFNFEDTPTEPFTTAFAKTQVFTGVSSANAFYTEQSFGELTLVGALGDFTGDVFGWYTVPFLSTECSSVSYSAMSNARTQAAADNFVLSNYDVIIYGVYPLNYCGLPGGTAGSPGVMWFPTSAFDAGTIEHELGHVFGRSHANGYECVDASGAAVPFSANCTVTKYGNYFSVMGQAGLHGHFSVFDKASATIDPSWLVADNILDVTAAGDYTIYPLELETANPMALRIARGDGRYLYIDFRKPLGFDNTAYVTNRPGVLLYIAPRPGDGESFLLDMTPGDADSFFNAALIQGQTFTDAIQGITVTATTVVAGTSATLHVAFNGSACTLRPPSLSITPTTQTGAPGETLTYSVILTNPNLAACGNTTYKVSGKAPSGWTLVPSTRNETLAPGASVTRTFTVTSPTKTRERVYNITQTATGGTRKLSTIATAQYNAEFAHQ